MGAFLVVALVIGSYLLGSISFSVVIGKLKGVDIRQHGSGNAGATNTTRVLGWKAGIIVLILDILKGVIAVLIANGMAVSSMMGISLPVLCGLAVIIGHNWPVFFRFKGGKGIATTIGVMLTLAPVATLISCLVAIGIIAFTRYVSLGSLLLTATLPLFIWWMNGAIELVWMGFILFVLALFKHRTNIIKLVNGTESKLGSKRSN